MQQTTQLPDLQSRRFKPKAIRLIASDIDGTLLRGGVFLYPPTKQHAKGKLRLMYEANPIAFLAEQAGGLASDGSQRILDIPPTSLHQRTPLLVGSREEVSLMIHMLADNAESAVRRELVSAPP